jgi:hypothetical protein
MNLRLSSSVCYADDADDIDMGRLSQDALIRSLGGLMLASKAMGRAALMLAVDAEPEWRASLAQVARPLAARVGDVTSPAITD